MAKNSNDYIPYECEYQAELLKRAERVAANSNPYIRTYVFDINTGIYGIRREEVKMEMSADPIDAIEYSIKQWAMVGVHLHDTDFTLVEVK